MDVEFLQDKAVRAGTAMRQNANEQVIWKKESREMSKSQTQEGKIGESMSGRELPRFR